jgi:hypothetical protein
MVRTEAIKAVLACSGNKHLTSLYHVGMETQVNVARDNGERVTAEYNGKRWVGWQAPNGERWKSFRIPWNAKGEPQFTDSELKFDLMKHVEGIGMTGWDWQKKESCWVGYDFDSIVNHKAGLSEEELVTIQVALRAIPFVDMVKSTSGKGIHVYIHIESGFHTDNHTEHAAVSRSILTLLSKYTGYDLQGSVDVCGGVLWVYHRKQEGTDGLSIIHTSQRKLRLEEIPKNWRDHVSVTSGKTKRIGINFDDSTVKFTALDNEHKLLLRWLSTMAKHDNWWDSDHNMLVCHTLDLAVAHKELHLRGVFFTSSSGSSEQNCFCFPISDGGWTIRRHGKNVREHESWKTDSSGWTRCTFNTLIDFETSSVINGGIENSSGEFVFPTTNDGLLAILSLGTQISPKLLDGIPEYIKSKPISIKEKNGKIIVSIDKSKDDSTPMPGFLINKKGTKWERVINYEKPKREVSAPDHLLRHTICEGADSGWYINVHDNWILHNKSNASTVLAGETSCNHGDIEVMMSECILNPWDIVNLPFVEEYPGDRQWNKNAASLRYVPSDEYGSYKMWTQLLEHVGSSLTDSVLSDVWCQDNAIKTGGEYLLLWFASMLQRPLEPLPYLFFVGEQNTGKSTLHEAFGQLILHRGYSRADVALVNDSGFNGEIANAVLCVVEETDLRKNKDAANRLKDWVTGKTININQKYKTPYDRPNATHWIQCANDILYCMVFPGDTRIVIVRVPTIKEDIPKYVLMENLKTEAKNFLSFLMKLELPPIHSRLAIPCLSTHDKVEMQQNNMSEIELFTTMQCTPCQGELIEINEFHNAFLNWLPDDSRSGWTLLKTSRNFPRIHNYCKGKYGADNSTFIANIRLNNNAGNIIAGNPSPIVNDFYFRLNQANGRIEKCLEQQ